MAVLHTFSDYRWTGPAPSVAHLVRLLQELGIDARLAPAAKHRNSEEESIMVVRARGAGLEPVTDFALLRYFRPLEWWRDCVHLSRYLDQHGIDILHTHLDHDFHIGAVAAKLAKRRVRVIRTNHKDRPLRGAPLIPRRLLMRFADAYMTFSRGIAERDQKAYSIPDNRLFVIEPAVDLHRFSPRHGAAEAVRKQLGLAPDAVLGATIARVQAHRRWDLVVGAVERAHARVPSVRHIVLGKGGGVERILRPMLRERGLEDVILTPGYRGDDYVDFLSALDYALHIKAGSDGACLAVRQVMAMGKPVVATNLGMLPELIPHDRAGLITTPDAESLGDAIATLASDTALRLRLGRGAREEAEQRFDSKAQADAVAEMYGRIMSLPASGRLSLRRPRRGRSGRGAFGSAIR